MRLLIRFVLWLLAGTINFVYRRKNAEKNLAYLLSHLDDRTNLAVAKLRLALRSVRDPIQEGSQRRLRGLLKTMEECLLRQGSNVKPILEEREGWTWVHWGSPSEPASSEDSGLDPFEYDLAWSVLPVELPWPGCRVRVYLQGEGRTVYLAEDVIRVSLESIAQDGLGWEDLKEEVP